MKVFLAFLPLCLMVGCGDYTPKQVEGPGFPAPTRVVNRVSVISHCEISKHSNIETDVECAFYNGDYNVSSVCVQASFYRHVKDELVIAVHPFCSGGIAPRESRNIVFKIRSDENRKLSDGCGRKLETCYIGVEPVKTERIL